MSQANQFVQVRSAFVDRGRGLHCGSAEDHRWKQIGSPAVRAEDCQLASDCPRAVKKDQKDWCFRHIVDAVHCEMGKQRLGGNGVLENRARRAPRTSVRYSEVVGWSSNGKFSLAWLL